MPRGVKRGKRAAAREAVQERPKPEKPEERQEGKGTDELSTGAVFKTFRPRFQVNADKMELVFELDWNAMPSDFLDRLQKLAQKYGTLTFKESEEQPERGESKHLPGQHELPGMGGGDGQKGPRAPAGSEEIV